MSNKLFAFTIFTIVAFIYGCNKEVSTPPVITFSNTTGLVFKDTVLQAKDTFSIQVNSSKTGPEGFLENGYIYKSTNGGADSTLYTMKFAYVHFSQKYSFAAGDSGNTERYTFKFVNESGLSSSASILLTIE